jgi:hypothetical protein
MVIMQEILIKYSVPSKFCLEPYGTIWKQMHDGEAYTLFIQAGINAEEPDWQKMSDFLEKVFEDKFDDANFIADCLKKYNDV